MKARIVAVVLAAAAVLSSGGAAAAAAGEEPEALIRQGVELRRRGKDAQAHGYFRRAYELAHTPRAAAQLGLAEQAVGEFLNAEAHLTEALAAVGDAWVRANKSALESGRASLRTHLGAVEVRGAPPGATVEVSGRAAIDLPPDGKVWVDPGESALRVGAPGYQAITKTVTVGAGARARLDVELAQEAAPPAPVPTGTGRAAEPAGAPPAAALRLRASDEDRGSRGRRITGLVVAGAGVAAVAGGVLLYLGAARKLDAIKKDAAASRPYDETNGNWQTYSHLGIGFMIGGGVALAGGTALYLLNRGGGTREQEVSLAVLPGPGPGLQIGGRF